MQNIVDNNGNYVLGCQRWAGPEETRPKPPQPNAKRVFEVGEVRAKFYASKFDVETSSEAMPGFYDDAALEKLLGEYYNPSGKSAGAKKKKGKQEGSSGLSKVGDHTLSAEAELDADLVALGTVAAPEDVG